MFHTGEQLVGADLRVMPLVAVDHRFRDLAAEVRILAGALRDAPPAGVAADVHHRAEHPVHAAGARLRRGDARRPLDQVHVPRSGQAERDGKDGLVPVDHVQPEDERDARTGLQGNLLALPQQRRIAAAIDAAEQALAQHLRVFVLFRNALGGDEAGRGMEIQLANLLIQRHPPHQGVNVLVHLGLRRAGDAADQQRPQENHGLFHIPKIRKKLAVRQLLS